MHTQNGSFYDGITGFFGGYVFQLKGEMEGGIQNLISLR